MTMYSKEDREIYFFDHLDSGAEPPDQKDVCGVRI